MAMLSLEIVTAERLVFSDDVDEVIAPGTLGEMAILPQHAPLLTTLEPGSLRFRQGSDLIDLALSGGFLEVRHNRVLVLADTAERAEEIDVARAAAAEARAAELVQQQGSPEILRQAEAALRRSRVRLKVARRRRGEGPAH